MSGVSVIIPTYNRSQLVKEAIESVLKQSYTDFEILVVDDGSSDNTGSIVKQIQDNRIKYYYKDNGGQSSARNFGLARASGEYIAYLDEDDLWLADYLKIMIEHLNTHQQYGAAYTRVIMQSPDGEKREYSSSQRYKSGWITTCFFELGPFLIPSATCFRKAAWKDVFWDEALRRIPDYDVFLRISTKQQFLFVPDTYIIKRWFPENLSSSESPVGFICKAYILERFHFHFGGSEYVSLRKANRKISHACRKAAKVAHTLGNKSAAIMLSKKAISYRPADLRLYIDLLRIILNFRQEDIAPNWQMPRPLPPYITVAQKPGCFRQEHVCEEQN